MSSAVKATGPKATGPKAKKARQDAARALRTQRDPRWEVLLARRADFRSGNGSLDEVFVYGVETTGVFCRPGCPSRLPRPEHVTFHVSAATAAAAGYRPCKRCRPDAAPPRVRQELIVARLCRLIETSERIPRLGELAEHVGLSPFHTHRLFRTVTGLTPRAYATERRAHRLRAQLPAARSVTEAIHAAGYGSSGHFYARADATLGMTPTQYRAGARGLTIRYAIGRCRLGRLLVASTDRGVCAVLLGENRAELLADLQRRFSGARLTRAEPDLAGTMSRVVALVEEPWSDAQLPLDLRGTALQQRVWRALRRIPPGERVTYGELARRIGKPGSARAIASACAANPLAVAVPCHRVVRSDGDLAGYRWGLKRKRWLLERESARRKT